LDKAITYFLGMKIDIIYEFDIMIFYRYHKCINKFCCMYIYITDKNVIYILVRDGMNLLADTGVKYSDMLAY